MSTSLILVDSNIIVYALNTGSTKNTVAQVWLQKNVSHLAITHQNICESLRVLTHKQFPSPMTPTDAVKALDNIIESCQVIAPDHTTHQLALALMRKYSLSGDKIFDAYLAATALSAGITTIATDNTKDFSAFENITLINPFLT